MRVIRGALDQGKTYSSSISVLHQSDLVSWDREVMRPVIVVAMADRVLELSLQEVNTLRRELDEVVMDIEERRSWR